MASSWILFISYQDNARSNTHQIWIFVNFDIWLFFENLSRNLIFIILFRIFWLK